MGEYPPNVCAAVPIGVELEFNVIAQTNCPDDPITNIQIIGPSGTLHTSIAPYGSSGNQWYTTVTWTPTASQVGANLICASATDSEYLVSPVVCYNFLVS